MCRKDRPFYMIPLSGSDGSGESLAGDFRIHRLNYVLGYLDKALGDLSFIESIHDHKGLLTVTVCPDLYKDEYEIVIQEAWEAAYEASFEIDKESACASCTRNSWKK